MSNKITTTVPLDQLTDLGGDWRVVAFRPNGVGGWRWHISTEEARVFQNSVKDGIVSSVQRRDPDGTRLLARLKI